MFDTLRNDIRCVLDRDPAATSALEVIFCYPGFRAVRNHRLAHALYGKGLRFLPRVISELSRHFTGVDFHPGAEIGQRLFIDHASGVVIGETTVIGDDVTLYQGATLGGTGKDTGKRHPTLGNFVTVSAGASVLGPLTIGDGAKIGAGAVVLKDVPENATVVGVPGQVVRIRGCDPECCALRETCGGTKMGCPKAQACAFVRKPSAKGEDRVDLDQVHLPDPVQEQMRALAARMASLELELRELREENAKLKGDGAEPENTDF